MVWVVSLSTMDVSTHCVAPENDFQVFGVWLSLVRLWVPLAHPVLYPPEHNRKALPK